MQEVIESLFPNIRNSDTIKAYKYGRYAKADIVVSVNGVHCKTEYSTLLYRTCNVFFTNAGTNMPYQTSSPTRTCRAGVVVFVWDSFIVLSPTCKMRACATPAISINKTIKIRRIFSPHQKTTRITRWSGGSRQLPELCAYSIYSHPS